MKRLLPISLLLAALCISTAAFAQKDKVVEASSKRKPAWIGSSDRSHFAVTEVGETLAAASGKCMASIRQYIVNAVAVNVSSAEKMATRQITRDQLVTAMSDYSSALMTEAGHSGIFNPGIHGFSEVLYAVSSAANNNGSAFAGLSANSPFWNCLLAFCMFVGRFGIIVPVMAIAGSLVNKKIQPTTTGTLPTHGALFIGLLTGTVLLVGALTFIPALALGPVAEYLSLR